MPLYRMQRSGLHHSADLCQKIVAQVGCSMDWQILRRKGNDKRQSSLQGKARAQNLRKSFTLAEDAKTRIKSYGATGKIWVVDDILTTGATLRHACAVARRTKQPIFAFSFARVLHD
jgi:predicted amidophosphoribosyltransferase